MKAPARARLLPILGFAAYFVAVWLLWDTVVVYPLKIFVVLLHEISHGLAALLTGGSIERIELDPYQGGACHCPGGNAFVTLTAGYLGSVAWGALLLEGGLARRVPARWLLGGIGVLILSLSAVYVRGGFGLIFGLAFGGALLVAARWLSVTISRTLLVVLGLTSCLYAIFDIKSDILDRPHLRSDAVMLSELTGVPTTLWGVIWISVAVGVAAWLLRRAYRRL